MISRAAAVSLLAATVLCLPPAVVAQGASPARGKYARIVVILPKPGQDSAFEAGYQRHIAWHRANKDTWTWRGWSFVLGERLDAFMDGTFDHELTDFDHPVDPAGDGADNRSNVEPWANFLSHAVYERIDGLSQGTPLPDDSPWVALTTWTLAPGQAAAFEKLVATSNTGWSSPRFTWFRLAQGGDVPIYLLLQSAASFGSAAGLPPHPVTLSPRLSALVREVRSEVIRYRTEMSYSPAQEPAQ